MDLLYKYKRAFLLVGMGICVVAMIITLNPEYRPGLVVRSLAMLITPLQSAATSATNWVSSRFAILIEMDSLQQENTRLREQIGWLEIENQRLQLAGEENRHLLELVDIRERYAELPTIGARIISHDHSGWYSSFSIDRGTRDGIEPNMVVLGPGGLVGVVNQAFTTHSQVFSIIDDRTIVAVQSVRTQDEGMVRGDSTLMGNGLIRMDHISYAAQIMMGDELITSTLSALFPPGIIVGTVVDIQPTPDGLAQFAIVSPAANVMQLESVLVVTQSISTTENYDE
ncbi:MAG: rod shape-determining protein MreC [Defluviitaleaceae bacterium]|nr:rod shape-determining protein MreC [Defluviitaleaceae bacterium]